MKRAGRNAFKALQKIGAPVIESNDYGAHFIISGETNCTGSLNCEDIWADYWEAQNLEHINEHGEIVWAFGINPKIHAVLKRYDLFCEWINPGMLGVYNR